MADAKVHDIEALETFLAQLRTTQERLYKHLEETRSEIARIEHWMHAQLPDYWKEQERVAKRKWVEARESLLQCEAVTRSDDKPACSEHRKRLELWTRRTKECEQKLRWLKAAEPRWRTELQNLELKLQHLVELIDTRLPVARHHLEKKLEPLRQYAQLTSSGGSSSNPSNFQNSPDALSQPVSETSLASEKPTNGSLGQDPSS